MLNARLFANAETGRAWDRCVTDEGGEVLCVSQVRAARRARCRLAAAETRLPLQFTLYGRLKGNKPDFSAAMPPQAAREAYAALLGHLRGAYRDDAVRDGVFGAMMSVQLVNDGPVTLVLDSQARD